VRAIVAGIFLLLTTSSTWAWSEFGHVLICEIAYRTISDEARVKLNELIDNQTFLDEHGNKLYPSFNHACLREDEVRKRPSEHFANYPRSLTAVTDEQCPGNNKCVISAIEEDSQRLADTTLSVDDRFVALMALGHWVGDIHEPLHISYADDRGGNNIKKTGTCPARNLHAVWDKCIVEEKILTTEEPILVDEYAKFTPMYRAADWMIEEVTEQEIAEWTSSEPWQWAAESYEIATTPEVGYCKKKADGCWYSDTVMTYNGDETHMRSIEIRDSYLEAFRPVVILRIKQAGLRLAARIEKALKD
jgi:hypothetical protein